MKIKSEEKKISWVKSNFATEGNGWSWNDNWWYIHARGLIPG